MANIAMIEEEVPEKNDSGVSRSVGTPLFGGVPLLGKDYNSLDGGFPIPVSERGRIERRAVLEKLESGRYSLENKPCLCGEIREELVCTVDRYRIPHRTVLCPRCGLVRTNPRLTQESYIDFYTHHYRAIYERPGQTAEALFPVQAYRSSERATFIVKHAKLAPGAKVLELGCGGGWNLIPFQKQGYAVEGYDYDEEYLAAGRCRGLALNHGGIEDAEGAGKTYDLVILSHVLEHFLAPQEELVRIKKLLKPEGWLYVEVPCLFAVTTYLPRYWQSAHTYSFVPGTLTNLMNASGYDMAAMESGILSLWRRGASIFNPAVDPALAERTRKFLVSRERWARMKNRFNWAHSLWIWLHSFKRSLGAAKTR